MSRRLIRKCPGWIIRFVPFAAVMGGSLAAPANSVAPVISGNTQVGQTLSTTDGTWTGSPTFTYQWQRAGIDIASATANTYVLVGADAGAAITCNVTGTNAGGNATAGSNSLTIDVYIVFLTSKELLADTTAYSGGAFDGISIGTAAANRKIVAMACSRDSGGTDATVTGSFAGQAAASVVHRANAGTIADILIASVPTGTSGNFSITFSNTRNRCGLGLWAIYGAGASTTDTDSSIADPAAVTLTVPAHGVAVGGGYNASSSSVTWTGTTERFDVVFTSEGHMYTGSDLSSTAGGDIAISGDWATAVLPSAVFASWGP